MMTGIWEFDTQTLHTQLVDIISPILKEKPVEFEEIVVFGSYGRGVANTSSDLDILLVVSLTETMQDHQRRDLFTGIATTIDQSTAEFTAPIDELDSLVCTLWNRDKILRDCLEDVPQEELENAPCLAYSLTNEEKITVLHP